ncbi:hypothetical protein GCM10029992_37560 [Glycomyces albus]
MNGIDIVKRLATGIVHLPPAERASGRLGLVGVVGETGLEVMRAVPRWDTAVLVAVLQRRQRVIRRHWRGLGWTVYTRDVESPVVLGTGEVHTATTDPSGICDLIGVRPADETRLPWLDRVAIDRVAGQYARLELHRPPQARGTTVPRIESA